MHLGRFWATLRTNLFRASDVFKRFPHSKITQSCACAGIAYWGNRLSVLTWVFSKGYHCLFIPCLGGYNMSCLFPNPCLSSFVGGGGPVLPQTTHELCVLHFWNCLKLGCIFFLCFFMVLHIPFSQHFVPCEVFLIFKDSFQGSFPCCFP